MSTRTWPVLYTKGKNGELRRWQVSVEGDKVVVAHGVQGGATTVSKRTATPKNVGRSNETTGEHQAILEAEAAHKFKLDRKYSLTPEDAQAVVPLPMLAKEYKAKGIKFPVDVQPKLDGVRAIARWEGDHIVLVSRGGKTWTAVRHINEALRSILPKDSEFDGEIYLHGKPFQWISSRSKKAHPDNDQLHYCVYDMPTVYGDDSLTWQDRKSALQTAFTYLPPSGVVQRVDTVQARMHDQVKQRHDAFVAAGYEGAIIRLSDGLYEYGHRSGNLLKMKQFDDAEFEIVGYTDGEGSEEGLVIWNCANDLDHSQSFFTRPKGTHEDRIRLFNDGERYIGQKLKVKFFGRTDDGLPRFPIAEGIRLPEDMD